MKITGKTSSDFAKEKLRTHEEYNCDGPSLGLINRSTLKRDPKHLLFTLSRYKFVAKMLAGKKIVCEIGCHEATGSLIVAKEVGYLMALDFQEDVIDFCKKNYGKFDLNISFEANDALDGILQYTDVLYDGIYALDVLEHIDPSQEDLFMERILEVLDESGVVILGIPSLESQVYASPVSKAQHINCKTMYDFNQFCLKYYHNVFMFGMNDEVLHTGFGKMCHYLFAICTVKK